MTAHSLVQLLLYGQVFIMGILVTLAVRHGYAHFRHPLQPPEAPSRPPTHDFLSPTARQHLAHSSETQFQAILGRSTAQLEKDLGITTGHINNLVMRLATEIISGELERYRAQLADLHKQAETNLGGISQEVAAHKAEIEAKMAQELETEKQRLIKQIDTKLGDAVGSFLVETLQHNIDLGSQGPYLISLLEEHKADFVKEVGGNDQPAK